MLTVFVYAGLLKSTITVLEPLLRSALLSFFMAKIQQNVLENSSEILVHIDVIASHGCCMCVGCTSMM